MTRLKMWAARLGILALIAAGFGGVAWGVCQSVPAGIAGAAIGLALFAKRACRVSIEDIAF